MPLHLQNVLRLLPDIAPKWCQDNLLHSSYETIGSLVHALVIALDYSEAQLCLAVKQLLLSQEDDVHTLMDLWLQQKGLVFS